MRKISRKNIIGIIIFLVIILVIYLFIKGCNSSNGLVYEYEKASIGDIKKTISVTGRLEVLNSHKVLSKRGGLVTNVYVDFNQKVKKHQLLAKLDTSKIEQTLAKVEAEMERASLDLLSAKRERDGKRNLYKENLISKKDMELAELKYKKVSSLFKQIKVDYKIALKEKDYTRILSPSNGIVISREIEGNTQINSRKILFIIAEDLSKMRLIIHVDESDIGYVKKGQNVQFTVSAYPDNIFTGYITQVRIKPIKVRDIVSYQAIVICKNDNLLLKPGMTATVTVVVSSKSNVLKVPNEAFIVSPIEIKPKHGEKHVWKKSRLSISKLPVEKVDLQCGLVGDNWTEVISGEILENDEILVRIYKSFSIKD
ncbi:MAG: efflux RND transporter periplasmic adaptor subunit [Spirochaetota bacterium]|nr:efflux RND transporter periplasmic adaptor subunit [Spirochaetota bacterium]